MRGNVGGTHFLLTLLLSSEWAASRGGGDVDSSFFVCEAMWDVSSCRRRGGWEREREGAAGGGRGRSEREDLEMGDF